MDTHYACFTQTQPTFAYTSVDYFAGLPSSLRGLYLFCTSHDFRGLFAAPLSVWLGHPGRFGGGGGDGGVTASSASSSTTSSISTIFASYFPATLSISTKSFATRFEIRLISYTTCERSYLSIPVATGTFPIRAASNDLACAASAGIGFDFNR